MNLVRKKARGKKIEKKNGEKKIGEKGGKRKKRNKQWAGKQEGRWDEKETWQACYIKAGTVICKSTTARGFTGE